MVSQPMVDGEESFSHLKAVAIAIGQRNIDPRGRAFDKAIASYAN